MALFACRVYCAEGLHFSAFIFYVSMTLLGQKRYRDGDTYDHSLQLHYRQFLVAHVFADLPSPSPFLYLFHEFFLVPRAPGRAKNANNDVRMRISADRAPTE